jgi:hypothetical protein
MTKIHNEVQEEQLGLHLAGSGGIAAWARAHDIPERTASTWSRSPWVHDWVEALRRAVLAAAVRRPGADARAWPRRERHNRHDRPNRIGLVAEIDGEAP